MTVSGICKPVLVTEIMTVNFIAMDSALYAKTLAETLVKALRFTRLDDSTFSGSLNVDDAIEYGGYVKNFLEALKDLNEDLNDAPRNQKTSANFHARVIAWLQVISVFRTLHGRPSFDD